MESSADILLGCIRAHFSHPTALHGLTKYLVDPDTKISLRMLDWLVTNYSKKHCVAYLIPDDNEGETRIFNMYLEYKSQLKSFSKSMFDPFKRGARVTFHDSHGKSFESTVGQLNFFKWALRYGVIEYALDNSKEIEKDMVESTKKRILTTHVPAQPAPVLTPVPMVSLKRSHLSKMRSCTTTTIKVRVTFR